MARNSKHCFKKKCQSCKTTKSSACADNQQPLSIVSQNTHSISSSSPQQMARRKKSVEHEIFNHLHWIQLNAYPLSVSNF